MSTFLFHILYSVIRKIFEETVSVTYVSEWFDWLVKSKRRFKISSWSKFPRSITIWYVQLRSTIALHRMRLQKKKIPVHSKIFLFEKCFIYQGTYAFSHLITSCYHMNSSKFTFITSSPFLFAKSTSYRCGCCILWIKLKKMQQAICKLRVKRNIFFKWWPNHFFFYFNFSFSTGGIVQKRAIMLPNRTKEQLNSSIRKWNGSNAIIKLERTSRTSQAKSETETENNQK